MRSGPEGLSQHLRNRVSAPGKNRFTFRDHFVFDLGVDAGSVLSGTMGIRTI